jgi:hypothetical protein
MISISVDRLQNHRKRAFRIEPGFRIHDVEGALRYVDERGFIYFWPIKDVLAPSLWTAVAGDRPVPSNHDDPGHITWNWKDRMLDKRRWYYAKVLRGRSTLISLDVVPYFYALSENYGEPEEDYLDQYREGMLSQTAKVIFEALLFEGPLDTVTLRRKIRMMGKASNSPFDRGLTALQKDFKILPVGVSDTGAWRYSFIYDLVHRYYPDLPVRARPISRDDARKKLTSLYVDSVGAASLAQLRKLFQWKKGDLTRCLDALVETGKIRPDVKIGSSPGSCYALTALTDPGC